MDTKGSFADLPGHSVPEALLPTLSPVRAGDAKVSPITSTHMFLAGSCLMATISYSSKGSKDVRVSTETSQTIKFCDPSCQSHLSPEASCFFSPRARKIVHENLAAIAGW